MAGVSRIGLIFVHGVGDQARFAHLRRSVRDLAETMLQAEPGGIATTEDRTARWPIAPGAELPGGPAPVTLTIRSPRRHIRYDCHEAWWADLAGPAGGRGALRFLPWGLGQWAAPIHRAGDSAGQGRDAAPTCLPGGGGSHGREMAVRLRLLIAAVAAVLLAIGWGLGAWAMRRLAGRAPSPMLIADYLGDVQRFTAPVRPGDSTLADPGQPHRTGIRRRMVRQMVAVAADPAVDGWYIVAHSLGSVIAHNALAETGHALPNHLSPAQWQALPAALKRDAGCARRAELAGMLPARGNWLNDADAIDRPALFARLRGVLTHGSPIDSFAALWPRILATAADRRDGRATFPPECRWINLAAPHDPVATPLASLRALPAGLLPAVDNVPTPAGWNYLACHNRYLAPVAAGDRGIGAAQKRAVARWLAGDAAIAIPRARPERAGAAGRIVPVASIGLLWGMAALLVTLATSLAQALIVGAAPAFASADALLMAAAAAMGPLIGLVLCAVVIAGLARGRAGMRGAALARAGGGGLCLGALAADPTGWTGAAAATGVALAAIGIQSLAGGVGNPGGAAAFVPQERARRRDVRRGLLVAGAPRQGRAVPRGVAARHGADPPDIWRLGIPPPLGRRRPLHRRGGMAGQGDLGPRIRQQDGL